MNKVITLYYIIGNAHLMIRIDESLNLMELGLCQPNFGQLNTEEQQAFYMDQDIENNLPLEPLSIIHPDKCKF